MIKLYCITLALFLFSTPLNASELIGIWKSNEELTLESMSEFENEMTQEVRKLFKNDFFGQLIAEYREKESRSYFQNPKDNVEEMYEFRPYQLLEENEQYFLISYFDELNQEQVTKKLYREGNCFYLFVSKWNFKEFFCRHENEP